MLLTGVECCNNSHYMMRMWKITQYYHQMLQNVESIFNLPGLLDFQFHQVHLHYQWNPTSLKPSGFLSLTTDTSEENLFSQEVLII